MNGESCLLGDNILPYCSPEWSPLYRGAGGSPFFGTTYCPEIRFLVENLYNRGLSRDFQLIGNPQNSLVAIKSQKHGSKVQDPFKAFLTPPPSKTGSLQESWDQAKKIAVIFKQIYKNRFSSIAQAAYSYIKDSKYLDQETADYFTKGYYGGIQWSPPYDFRKGAFYEGLVYSDLHEAYTSALFKRQLPLNWKWESNPRFPSMSIEDLDSMYFVRVMVPHWITWGFPNPYYVPGKTFEGMITGEELISVGLTKNSSNVLDLYGRLVPENWAPHPNAQEVLSLPKPIRKRIGNVAYGLHGKQTNKIIGYLTEKEGENVVIDRDGEIPIWWVETGSKMKSSRIDYAALTTARVRSAMHRAALSLPEGTVLSMYVDGIVALSEPFDGEDDSLWPGVFKWKLEQYGNGYMHGPAMIRWTDKRIKKTGEADEISTS